jgi:hypothetical protein
VALGRRQAPHVDDGVGHGALKDAFKMHQLWRAPLGEATCEMQLLRPSRAAA